MATRVWPFADASGITIDPLLIEVVGGAAQLVGSMLPADLTLYARFNSLVNFDAFFAVGSAVATENNAPQHDAVIKKFGAASMDLSAAVVGRGIRYAAAGNAVWSQTGTVAYQFRPNYTGLPGGVPNNFFFHLWDISGPFTANEIGLWHDAGTGVIHFVGADQAGTNIGGDFNVWSPTAGVWYHHELNCRFSAPVAQRFFIDGVALGPTLVGVGTVNGAARDFVYVGTEEGFTNGSGGWYDEFQIFNTVQHVANFIPPTGEIGGGFPMSDPTILFEAIQPVSFVQFLEATNLPAGSDIRWAIRMRGWQFYYNDHFWDHVPDTEAGIANTCTAAEMRTFLGLKPPIAAASLVAYLQSDGTANPQLQNLQIDYSPGGN